jgi:hypothetical protein
MPFKVISQKGWVKGVVASMDRFSVPKGAILKASNLLLSDRGGLRVCDGTSLQSSLPAAPGPILELGSFVSSTFGLTKLAATSVVGGLDMYSWAGNGDSLAFLGSLPMTPGWFMPQFIQFGGFTIISLGNAVTPYQYAGGGGFAVLTTSNGTPSGVASWKANHYYSVGDRIVADDGNSKQATFQVVDVTVGAASGQMSNSSPIGGLGGQSGGSTPAFGGTAVIGTGNTVHDNQIIWMLIKETADFGQEAVPAGAAHIINHQSALWAWNTAPQTQSSSGTIDGPSVVRQSAINNPNSWPLANAAFVGKDDGTQGTGIATFTVAEAGISPSGSLVLFKDYSTYLVTGTFGIQNFGITAVKSDMGCIAPRSVQFATGFGVIRFSHLGFALLDGINDRLISEEIRPYIFGRADITGVDFTQLASVIAGRSALTTNPPMYACVLPTADGLVNRMFCYDLVMRAWMVVDFNNNSPNFPITAMHQMRTPVQLGPNEGVHTYIAVLNRATSGVEIQQWQQGDAAWYDAGAVQWFFTPPEVGDPASRAYFRRCNVRLAAPQPGRLTGFFNVGNEALPNNSQPQEGAGPSSGTPPNIATQAAYNGDQDLGVSLDVAQTGPSLNGTFSGSGPATIEGVDWHVVPKNPRPFGQRW